MKTIGSILMIIAMACALSGCDDAKEITVAEFMQMIERGPETMRNTEYQGVTNGNAVVKVSEMSLVNQDKWKDSYYYTPTNDLPPRWVSSNRPSMRK